MIHQENRGVSAARNAGLGAAAGETVAWLDGDDQMGPQALEKLNAALLETGASMAICNYENVERSGAREKRYVQRPNEVISGEEALTRLLRREITPVAVLQPRAPGVLSGRHVPRGHAVRGRALVLISSTSRRRRWRW